MFAPSPIQQLYRIRHGTDPQELRLHPPEPRLGLRPRSLPPQPPSPLRAPLPHHHSRHDHPRRHRRALRLPLQHGRLHAAPGTSPAAAAPGGTRDGSAGGRGRPKVLHRGRDAERHGVSGGGDGGRGRGGAAEAGTRGKSERDGRGKGRVREGAGDRERSGDGGAVGRVGRKGRRVCHGVGSRTFLERRMRMGGALMDTVLLSLLHDLIGNHCLIALCIERVVLKNNACSILS
mmetsp:Transcript_8477/g.18637  ORF Transcript_8477/g.18637 Transcript_8477/m.18637 type:complete len:233 (-) Transcript_8477:6-704(-)